MPLDTPLPFMQRPTSHGTTPAFPGRVSCASILDAPWHAAFTKPGAERKTEAKLRDEQAGVWLPMECRDRDKRLAPLIPRYIFLQLTGERTKWGCVIRSAGGEELASVLRSPTGRPLVVPLAALDALRGQCAPDGVLYPVASREMRRGDLGRAATGPFQSFTGICRMTTRQRVELLLSMFGRIVPVWYDRRDVELF